MSIQWRSCLLSLLVQTFLLVIAANDFFDAGEPASTTFGITTLTLPRLELNPDPAYWARMRVWQGKRGDQRVSLLHTHGVGIHPGLHRQPDGTILATTYTTATKTTGAAL